MKALQYIFCSISLLCLLFGVGACDDGAVDYLDKNPPLGTMTLTASATELTLVRDRPFDEVLTFTWTAARDMPEEYLVSYISKLDIEGNNFASAIRTQENEFVFTKTYTTLELQNLLINKWARPSNRPTNIEFEILAKWDGGGRYVMPEVCTASVSIRPYKVGFDFDKLWVGGSAVPGSRTQFATTPESEYIYVWTGELIAGSLEIQSEYQGATDSYVCPLTDVVANGVEGDVLVLDTPAVGWTITEPGEYRVVFNMSLQTVTIYTPGNVLQPTVVEWTRDGALQTTTVTQLWIYGNNWSWTGFAPFKPSLIDPQVFYFSGNLSSINKAKFGVAQSDVAYVYSPVRPTDAKVDPLTTEKGVLIDLGEGAVSEQRNSYYAIPSGTNYITIDIRNKTILFETR